MTGRIWAPGKKKRKDVPEPFWVPSAGGGERGVHSRAEEGGPFAQQQAREGCIQSPPLS